MILMDREWVPDVSLKDYIDFIYFFILFFKF